MNLTASGPSPNLEWFLEEISKIQVDGVSIEVDE
jgi:hypothetical protein